MLAPRLALVAALAALAVVSLGPVVDAAVVVLQPSSQDAYIQQDKPNRITGAGPSHRRIIVKQSPPNTQVRRGLVQFDLSDVPTGSTIHAATLELKEGNNPNDPVTHGVHRILSSWLQSAVKWNTQPPFGVAPTDTELVPDDVLREFRSFDVTPDLQDFADLCSANHGWLVRDQDETGDNEDVNYVAREEDDPVEGLDKPRLTVDFTAPPCLVDADCADANPCTTNEQCVGGVCDVEPVDCDDGDPCTDDICDCTVGCVNAPICNDGFACTLDTCNPANLECSHSAIAGFCNLECSTGTCVADQDATNIDPETGCLDTGTAPAGTPCDDDDACTQTDECDGAGDCQGMSAVVCAPQSQCHETGTCDPQTGMCSTPPLGAGEPCDDDDACTQTDTCDGAGDCQGTSPVVCAPESQCHLAGTCDPQTGVCSNPPQGAGQPCDDGDACTQTDTCDGAGACAGGNDVVCTPLDDCHLTGVCDPQTGTCSSPVAGNGTPCSDGNDCTIDDACANGACLGDPMTCGDGTIQPSCNEECDDPGGTDPNCTNQCQLVCGPTPEPGCRQPVLGGKAFFKLNDKSPDKRDKLLWKWIKGSATTLADFGTPQTDTRYTLCVWDASANPQPILFSVIPPDGQCGNKPCWQVKKKALKYRDKALDPDGILFTLLKFGADTKAKIIVKGKGEPLPLPALPLTPTVTVQLHNDAGTCWEAAYSNPKVNVTQQFKARAD